MAGVKRKEVADAPKTGHGSKTKKLKASPPAKSPRHLKSSKAEKVGKKKTAPKKLPIPEPEEEDDVESDTTESENGFYGFSAKDEDASSASEVEGEEEDADVEMDGTDAVPKANGTSMESKANGSKKLGADGALNSSSSKEAHAKQRALAKERKAAKPNADSIARSKKIWERLRRKSHVPLEERRTLVNELFDIITGRVKDFVFKHDSVRVVQCALKYANVEQRRMIARELKGDYRSLAESRYAKFLIGKMLVEGGDEIRDMVVPEFYGHVRRMINHPEASWILDDIYRSVATPQQKAILLREWYGHEFAIFKSANSQSDVTATLSELLAQSPEKRKPIMSYLHSLINQLIQKKLTGFTMLHDAMLQYFLNTKPGSDEAIEFLELLKSDEEEGQDLLKNLAFTKSGSRVVCLALAYASSKDRRHILRAYKDLIETLACDAHGHLVLLAAYDVVDDTRETGTRVFGELLGKTPGEAQQQKVLALATHLTGRVALLYPLAGAAKWLLPEPAQALLREAHAVRAATSKKDPETRRLELVRALSGPLLAAVAAHAPALTASSFGCQFVAEVLLGAAAEADRAAAADAVADLAAGDPEAEGHVARSAAAGRMLKTLVQGGRYDAAAGTTVRAQPPLRFAEKVWARIEGHVGAWATGPASFVVVALAEAEEFDGREQVLGLLRAQRERLEKAAREETEEQRARREERERAEGEGEGEGEEKGEENAKKRRKKGKGERSVVGNAGARLLLEKLA